MTNCDRFLKFSETSSEVGRQPPSHASRLLSAKSLSQFPQVPTLLKDSTSLTLPIAQLQRGHQKGTSGGETDLKTGSLWFLSNVLYMRVLSIFPNLYHSVHCLLHSVNMRDDKYCLEVSLQGGEKPVTGLDIRVIQSPETLVYD